MAKYMIQHICGHAREVALFGPCVDRERSIAWLKKQPCPDCARATIEREFLGDNPPALTGAVSEKQLAYARDRRNALLPAFLRELSKNAGAAANAIVRAFCADENARKARFWLDAPAFCAYDRGSVDYWCEHLTRPFAEVVKEAQNG